MSSATDTAIPPVEAAIGSAGSKRRTRKVLGRFLPSLGILAVVAALWEAASHWFGVPKYILPSLEAIWLKAVRSWSDTLASATWVTTKEVLGGFFLAVVVAVAIALLLHLSEPLRNAVYPLLIGSQAIPIVVIAPVLAIIFGYTITPKLIVVAFICFFSMVVNSLDGLRSVDPEYIRLMRTLDGNRWSTLRRVQIPAALPSMFTGMRIAATYAPVGAVFGEYAGSQDGLGYVMIQATPLLQTDMVFAAIAILTIEAVLLFLAVSFVERMMCPWARRGHSV